MISERHGVEVSVPEPFTVVSELVLVSVLVRVSVDVSEPSPCSPVLEGR